MTSDNLRHIIMRWEKRSHLTFSTDQRNACVRLLQQNMVDIPAHATDAVIFAFYCGLKFERERASSMARDNERARRAI